jgi:carbon monoxide dehydrogenase subunit G
MTTFQSTTHINKSISEVYQFLADLNNHQQLITGDISDWLSTSTEASFTIRSTVKLSLKLGELIPNELITIIPAEKPPFGLEIKWMLFADGDQTDVKLVITADLNMMMKMVASGPLKQLANDETTNLSSILN